MRYEQAWAIRTRQLAGEHFDAKVINEAKRVIHQGPPSPPQLVMPPPPAPRYAGEGWPGLDMDAIYRRKT